MSTVFTCVHLSDRNSLSDSVVFEQLENHLFLNRNAYKSVQTIRFRDRIAQQHHVGSNRNRKDIPGISPTPSRLHMTTLLEIN